MKEFFEAYEHLKRYPEFDSDAITEKYTIQDETAADGEPIEMLPDFVFDTGVAFEYVMLAYAPDSSLSGIKDQQTKKQEAMKIAKVPRGERSRIIRNENPMIGDMITRLFREINDIDYELLISGKEAIETLLEVVRKPIDTRLQDDKERNAVKAKRECFEDAKAILTEVRKIYAKMNEVDTDLGQHVNQSVFKGGLAETLAKKSKKKN